MAVRIETLNDLFFALFRTLEEDKDPVVRGHGRPGREEYLRLFFPEELCRTYLERTPANLTWFFNDDPRNKAIRRSLIRLLEADPAPVIGQVHRKCMALLFPQGQHAAFGREELKDVLLSVRFPAKVRERLPREAVADLFEADPSAALARVILTLSLGGDMPALSERIWQTGSEAAQDSSPGGQLRHGNLLYLHGRREEAFKVYEKVAARLDREPRTPEETAMLCRMGQMLATGDGHYRDPRAAADCLRRAAAGADPQALYLLSIYSPEPEEAASALERAAELGHDAAVRALGNRLYAAGRRAEAAKWFRRGLSASGAEGGHCACMLGRIYEDRGDLPGALQLYRIAREKGDMEAWERLTGLDPEQEEQALRDEENEQPLRYCLVNGRRGRNQILLDSLTGPWHTDTCEDRRVATALEELLPRLIPEEGAPFPGLVIGLLGPDEEDCLDQALEVLDLLEKQARRLGSRRWALAEAVQIYLAGRHDRTALLLDAALGSRRSVIFPLRLCDSDWDSAGELFTAAPLFLPMLKAPEERQVRLTVLGQGDRVLDLVRQAAALPLGEGRETLIRVFAPDAERLEQQLQQFCPGIADALPGSGCPKVDFFPCGLASGEAAALLRRLKQHRRTGQPLPEDDPAQLLGQGNYYIVATGDDRENILLATWLRETLLKLDPSFQALPFIAVQVRGAATGRLVGELAADRSWHSRHDLFCFGSDSRYSLRSLQQDLTELRAQAVHLHYCPKDQPRQEALAGYYRRQYNRDSSRAAAMYLAYRLFSAGITLPEGKLYALPGELSRLEGPYRSWLEKEGSREAGARQEHLRWNCFLLSMGWERASVSQVQTYVRQGNPGHQLYLGKLHPFLCSWEELADGQILQAVEEAVRSRLPEKRIADPRIADSEMAAAAADLLQIG